MDEDEKIEADMDSEEAHGKPFACTPEDGIKDMLARLSHLERRLAIVKKNVADQPNATAEFLQAMVESERLLLRDINEARARLAEYRTMQGGRN